MIEPSNVLLTPQQALEAERVSIQQALDALRACPPPGPLGRVSWRALHWVYQRRLRQIEAAWQRGAATEGTSVPEPAMVLVPGGEFMMGSDPQKDKEAMPSEQPQHLISIPDYQLARTPVTNEQYVAFVQATGHRPPSHWENSQPPRGEANHPVIRVSWYDAADYCRWLSEATGKPYRLPTEAEWEKAARGVRGSIYPWGDGWDAKRFNTKESGRGGTTPVGSYPQGASPYGLTDMAGNVWEWTSSLSLDYPYGVGDGRRDPSSAEPRVLRGGSWLNLYDTARSAYRRRYVPAYHSRLHGFRCCMSSEEAP